MQPSIAGAFNLTQPITTSAFFAGVPSDGSLLQYRTSNGELNYFTLTGDCTISNTGSITCTKLNGQTPIVATGTWTPTVAGDSTAGVFTYGTQVGTYIKYVDQTGATWYTLSFHVSWTAITTQPVGNIEIKGIPTAAVSIAFFTTSMGQWDKLTLSTGYTGVYIQIAPNSTFMNVQENGSGQNGTSIPASGIGAPGQFLGQITYRTS